MATRLNRLEQGERNRRLVLDAARGVFLERGYGGATVDAIAEAAGFSKGVVYSQFAGKSDLFLALLEQRITERAAENARIAAGQEGVDGLLALLRNDARHVEEGGGWSLLLVEFRIAAARDPVLNLRYAAMHTRTLDHLSETIRAVLARGGLAPVYPPRVFAELILAIYVGSTLERAAGTATVGPELMTDLVHRIVEPI